MAKDDRPIDQIDYEGLQQAALRGVIRATLEVAARPAGLPGEHHLYISFRTSAAGVSLPADLRARYPDDMTPTSLVPDLAAANGISFGSLVTWLVENARCDA